MHASAPQSTTRTPLLVKYWQVKTKATESDAIEDTQKIGTEGIWAHKVDAMQETI